MTDASDEAIGRVNDRIADRAAQVRTELAAIGCLDLAEELKAKFGARLAYLKTANVELGSNPFPRPGCVWTIYEKPKVKHGDESGQRTVVPVSRSRVRGVPNRRAGKRPDPSAPPQSGWSRWAEKAGE